MCISQLDWILKELLLTAMKAILEGELSGFRGLTGGSSGLRSAPGHSHPLCGPSLYLMLRDR